MGAETRLQAGKAQSRPHLPAECAPWVVWDAPAKRLDQHFAIIHHSDRGSQYVSIRYTERLADLGISPSVGSKGDSYDNALADSTIGLYKTELIERRGSWRSLEEVELATLGWVDWYNRRRLHSACGNTPPAEFEDAYYRRAEPAVVVGGQ